MTRHSQTAADLDCICDAVCGVVQEQLLQQVITDSRAYGTLLGSGAIGDSGQAYPAALAVN